MNSMTEALVTIATAITGVAILALLVSKNSNTANVIQAGASGFSNALDVAISPVTGKATAPNLSYPNSEMFGGSAFTPSSINFGGGMSF